MVRIDWKLASTVALHAGLIGGVVVYTLFGALSMQWLESPDRVRASIRSKRAVETPLERQLKVYLGSEIAEMDPGVHSCLRYVLKNVMNKTKCAPYDLEHLNIQSIDSCYQFANFKKIGVSTPKMVPITPSPKIRTTTPIPVTDIPEPAEPEEKWSFGNALIFAFTVITTIGYGHVAPETYAGRVFVILYGLIGVPLALLTIADLGMFISMCIKRIIVAVEKGCYLLKKYCCGRRSKSKKGQKDNISTVSDRKSILETTAREGSVRQQGEEQKEEELGEDEEEPAPEEPVGRGGAESMTLCIVFTVYLFFGAWVLSAYEPEMDFFKALYFNFVTLTTIGLGDFVPKSFDYLFITLVYIGIGLALTTMVIEIAGDVLKKIHFAGRKMENVANAVIWFGGKKMTMKALVKNLGDKFNIPPEELANFNFDNFAENAMQVQAGKLKSLRADDGELSQENRAVSYTNLRRSMDANSIGFVDERRSSRLQDTIRDETGRTFDTLPVFYEASSIDGQEEKIPRLNLDSPYESDTSAPTSFDINYMKTMSTHKRY